MKRFIDICQMVLVLLGLALCGLFLTVSLGALPLHGNALQLAVFSGQNILAFILPSILMWLICFRQPPFSIMGASALPSARWMGIMLLIYFLGMPALNQIVFWNQEMSLPQFLKPFEDWCREKEELAEQMTEGLLSTTDILPTVVNILVIGVLTGIGEEFFFRGALQRGFVWCGVNHHTAIWTAAIIFSAVHFQFFGFVPRMLLGALFGYLYWWSGNIWVNATAHALNNTLVIVSTWCIHKGYLAEDFDMMGVADTGFPLAALISALAVAAVVYGIYRSGVLDAERLSNLKRSNEFNRHASESK